jgi:subtilisin family serine protease
MNNKLVFMFKKPQRPWFLTVIILFALILQISVLPVLAQDTSTPEPALTETALDTSTAAPESTLSVEQVALTSTPTPIIGPVEIEQSPTVEITDEPIPTSTFTPIPQLLEPPFDLQVFIVSEHEIYLNWRSTDPRITHFIIERAVIGEDNWLTFDPVEAQNHEYFDSTVSCETQYQYRLLALNQNDQTFSEYSQSVFVELPVCSLPEENSPGGGGFDYRGFEDIARQVIENGTIRIIIQLDTQFQAEGSFGGNERAVQAQRDAIDRMQENILGRLPDKAAQNARRFETIPFMALEVDETTLQYLINSPEVLNIEEDRPIPMTLDQSVPRIGADVARTEGYDGSGWAVAVLDTGVDKTHPFLSDKVVSEACFSTTDAGSTSTTVCPNGLDEQIGVGAGVNCEAGTDGCDHGTHVAGIVAGSNGSTLYGVAPGADIIAVQVFSKFTSTDYCGAITPCALSWSSDQILGLEHVKSLHDSGMNIASVNMSIGGGYYTNYCDSASQKAAIDNLLSVGIATVISSGNEGYSDGLSSPACISSAVSVGATTDSDTVASYSNSASFLDILAPGSSIYSSVPGTTYQSWNGTSMAAPHVAGTWALMKQQSPTASVSDILTKLQNTGVMITDSKNGITKPRIQVDLAMNLTLDAPTGLSAVENSRTAIDLSWTDNVADETAYHIERSADGSTDWTEIHVAAADTTTYQDTSLKCGTTYYYRVRAYRSSDTRYSDYSNTSNASTQACDTWYLAEGFSGSGTETYILVQNPNADPANVYVTYMVQGGGLVERSITVAANSRETIAAHDAAQVGPDQAFSTKIDSDQDVIVERAMYWPAGDGVQGGHVTTGIHQASTNWNLAEGYTGGDFDTYILVQNPTDTDANVTVTYMLQSGTTLEKLVTVLANSRSTLVAKDVDQVGPDQAFSTNLASDQPIIVERAMYFTGDGHAAVGVPSAQTTWYLAEGFTGAGFETFILLQNPNAEDANVNITYMLQGGGTIEKTVVVAANSRNTVAAHALDQVGLDQAFSTKLTADRPIIIERAMYWPRSETLRGGHDSPAVNSPALNWNLAEGFTGGGFETYILIQNPGGTDANVNITYMLQGGGTLSKSITVSANSRSTVYANDINQVGLDQAFSTQLTSDQPIIVERAMYFNGGGHNTTGVASP